MSRLFGIASVILTALLAYQYVLLRDVTAESMELRDSAEAIYLARLSLYTADSVRAVAALESGDSQEALDLLQDRICNDAQYLQERIDLVPTSLQGSIRKTIEQAEGVVAKRGSGAPTDLRSPSSVFSSARILPAYHDGSMIGLAISDVRPGSFIHSVGIRSGDIISSMNGHSLASPESGAKLLEALSKASSLTVEVIRDGEKTVLSIPMLPPEDGA